MAPWTTKLLVLASVAARSALGALEVDFDSTESIRAAASKVAEDLWTFYPRQPGWFTGLLDLPPPDGLIHWWLSGAFWGTLLEYRQFTGDKTYDDFIREGVISQVGDNKDYLPRNWSSSIGNDDQSFWALTAMLAAETQLVDPAPEEPQYVALVQAVFNEQSLSDTRAPMTSNCGGALRWQKFPASEGFKYINTVSNACYFNIGARLARYTNNQSYADLATTTWDKIYSLGYIDKDWNVYDGAHMPDCTDVNKQQFSYNVVLLLQGCAFMYNQTNGAEEWKERVEGLFSQLVVHFFPDGVIVEPTCEGHGGCNIDQRSFRGFVHRWLASTGQLVPFMQPRIMSVLRNSTAAAVKQCTGGDNGRMCGFEWASGKFDGRTGAIEQMNVLGALSSLLSPQANGPVTNTTGGTSIGNPNAGSKEPIIKHVVVTTGDRVGAAIITATILIGLIGAIVWMNMD